MSDAEDWERYPIRRIGLDIERYVPWPAALAEFTDGANFYQRIPDSEGLVFLRYGPQETPEAFLSTLTDALRTYEIVDDQTVEFLGEPARRLTITQRRAEVGMYRSETPGEIPTHATLPAVTTRIEVTAFTANQLPVLVGFRVDVDRLAEHRSTIDRIVASVSRLPEAPEDRPSR
jgi:hypothetical protein